MHQATLSINFKPYQINLLFSGMEMKCNSLVRKVERLGETLVDAKRASCSGEMQKL
jgi:hypothetical protein